MSHQKYRKNRTEQVMLNSKSGLINAPKTDLLKLKKSQVTQNLSFKNSVQMKFNKRKKEHLDAIPKIESNSLMKSPVKFVDFISFKNNKKSSFYVLNQAELSQ